MLTRLECIFGDAPPDRISRWYAPLKAAFPTLDVAIVARLSEGACCLDLAEWCDPTLSFWDFDQRVDEALGQGVTTIALRVHAAATAGAAVALMTRCQRWIGRRNRHTQGPVFDELLRAHRGLYDLRKPLVLADYRHALDTWQWTLRLDAEASAPLQTAALLHDIERIASEADVRIEHLATNYERFKARHARRGSEMTRLFLRDTRFEAGHIERVGELVARHETPAGDAELALLNDADALSFFSLNSSGYFDYYGPAHAERKIRYTLARMRRSAIAELATVRLRGDVARVTWRALAAAGPYSLASAS